MPEVSLENSAVSQPEANPGQDFLLAEYNALRDEILKRTEIQHQLISLALIASGTFLTINVTTAILAYPILALFIAAAWKQSDSMIANLGRYIRTRIEEPFLGNNQGWQHYFSGFRDPRLFGSLAHLASRGIIGLTQILIFFVGLLKTEFPIEDTILIILDFFAIVLTQIILRRDPSTNI
jgi:hypothetical protein